jgi:hypothetical protein
LKLLSARGETGYGYLLEPTAQKKMRTGFLELLEALDIDYSYLSDEEGTGIIIKIIIIIKH